MDLRPTLYMLLSGLAFSVMYVLAKDLSHLGGFAVTTFRALGTLLPTLAYLRYRRVSLRGNRPTLLLARGVSGAASLVTFFIAIETVPVTAAVAIRYLSPILAIAFVAWRLRERVHPAQWGLFAAAFAGVVMIKGFDARITTGGLALVLASAVLGGVTFALIKKIGRTEETMLIVAYFTGAATVFGVAGWGLTLDAHPLPTAADVPALLSIGLVGLVGQFFMTTAMQTGRASTVMPLKYVEAAFMLALGSYYLGETYSYAALVGIAFVVAANVGNLLVRQTAESRTAESTAAGSSTAGSTTAESQPAAAEPPV